MSKEVYTTLKESTVNTAITRLYATLHITANGG